MNSPRMQYDVKKGQQNERLYNLLKTAEEQTVDLVSEKLFSTNVGAYEHARRTAMYATAIGQQFNLDSGELEQLKLAAFFHELGIPKKSGKTASSEIHENSRIHEFHRQQSSCKLAQIPFLNPVATVIEHLLEHFDKSGTYGLGEEQIPFFSRIIAVADKYDELTGSYFKADLSHDMAVDELQQMSGSLFDPTVVDEFCGIKSIGEIRNFIEQEIGGIGQFNSKIYGDTNNLTLTAIIQEIKTNPILALDILRLANTFDNNYQTANLLTAVTRLGENKLRSLLERNGLPLYDSSLASAWEERSIRCALMMQLLAAQTSLMNPDDAYTLGLLQNIGEVLLMNRYPNKLFELKKIKEKEYYTREIEAFGVETTQISQWMLSVCGIREELLSAVGLPNLSKAANSPIVLLLNVARKISNADENESEKIIDQLEKDVFSLLHLNREELIRISESAIFISCELIEHQQKIYEKAE